MPEKITKENWKLSVLVGKKKRIPLFTDRQLTVMKNSLRATTISRINKKIDFRCNYVVKTLLGKDVLEIREEGITEELNKIKLSKRYYYLFRRRV